MIAVRWTALPKRKKLQAYVDLLKARREELGVEARIYKPRVSPYDQVVLEMEFESMTEYIAWVERPATPERIAFNEKSQELRRAGGSCEVWELE